jgi:hypothetical protein
MDSKFQKKLAAAQKNWTKAKTRAEEGGSGFTEIEDGRYYARLVGAEITEAKSSGRLQVAWKYKIVDGDYKGETKMDFDGLETEDNQVFIGRKLKQYGYALPDDLQEVEQILDALVKEKPLVRIRLKTRGEFQNVYVDKVFDKEDEDEVLDVAGAEAADDADETDETEETETTEETDEVEEADDEEEEAEAEEEPVELQVGMTVLVDTKEGQVTGTVLELLEQEEKVRVKVGTKVLKVSLDKLSFDEPAEEVEEEVEEEEVPEEPVAPPKKAQVKRKK